MNFRLFKNDDEEIAVLEGDGVVIKNTDDALDVMGNAGQLGSRKVVVMKSQLHPAFFDLKTGLAGEILQKFSNYGMQLVIVGDFSNIASKSLRDFIRESNRYGNIRFTGDLKDVIRSQ